MQKTGDYYYIVHALTGKYLVYSPIVPDPSHATRRVVHLAAQTNPNVDSAKFTVTQDANGKTLFVPKLKSSGDRYLNQAGHNRQSYSAVNGAAPTTSTGTLYDGTPITIAPGDVVRAIAYSPLAASGVSTATANSSVAPTVTYADGNITISGTGTLHYTTNGTPERNNSNGYGSMEHCLAGALGQPQRLIAYNTYQVKNYDNYELAGFSEEAKRQYRNEHWEEDLQKAYNCGKKMAETIAG